LSPWRSHDEALSTSVNKSFDDNSFRAPADSLGELTLSPDSASVDTPSEFTDNSSSSHSTQPLALSPHSLSSSSSDTSLSLSGPISDDFTRDSSSSTSQPSSTGLSPDSASLSVSEESSDNLSLN